MTYNYNKEKLVGGAVFPARATFSVGAEAADAIAVTFTFTDADGKAVDKHRFLSTVWLSATAGGAASAQDSFAATTNCTVIAKNGGDSEALSFVSVSNGCVITVTNAANETMYINIALPNGAIFSQALTFAP